MQLENRAPKYSVLNNIKKEIHSKLDEFSNIIQSLSLDEGNENNYLFLLINNIENFTQYFGYDLDERNFTAIVRYIQRENATFPHNFAYAIHNIICRRIYYYLNHLYLHYFTVNNLDNNNIRKMRDYFSTFINPETVESANIPSLIKGNDDSKRPSLSQLYLGYIDSELFTCLYYFEKYSTEVYKSSKDIAAVKVILYTKITNILDEKFKNNSFENEDGIFGKVQDESNILWALRLVFDYVSERRDDFYISDNINGKIQFQNSVSSLISKENYERIVPNISDLKRDITPELFNGKRTNLYILYNLLKLLKHKKEFSNEFIENINHISNKILNDFIISQRTEDNLYFLSLKFHCICLYDEIFLDLHREAVSENFTKNFTFDDLSESQKDFVIETTARLLIDSYSTIKQKIKNIPDKEKILNELANSFKIFKIIASGKNIYNIIIKNDELSSNNKEHLKMLGVKLVQEFDSAKIVELYQSLIKLKSPEINDELDNLLSKYPT